MKVAFIGFGEAASQIAIGLHDDGLENIIAFDVMQNDPRFSDKIKTNAQRAGATIVDGYKALVEDADIVLSVVPPHCALEAAESAKEYLHDGQLFVDMSSSTPTGKKAIGDALKDTGALYADAAIMGAPLNYQNKVPVLACGSGAEMMQNELNRYGMKINAIGENVGAASAIKLIRSIYMKGTAALGMEMLQAAAHFGVEDQVVESIRETMDTKTFIQTLNRLTTSTTIHAERRVHELEGSVQMLEEAELDATMVKAAHDKHVYIAEKNYRETLGAVAPEDWRAVAKLLSE